MVESCRIVEQALDQMPAGPLHVGNILFTSRGAGGRTDRGTPRGEVFYYAESDGSDTPAHVKVRTPTFANIPTTVTMVEGSDLADVPLIQAAIDPCYSCTDH
jgi:ech hydrogenase subunit E